MLNLTKTGIMKFIYPSINRFLDAIKNGEDVIYRGAPHMLVAATPKNDPQDIYDKLPDSKTPLLIVGSSRYSKGPDNPYEDNRIISLDTILMIQDGK